MSGEGTFPEALWVPLSLSELSFGSPGCFDSDWEGEVFKRKPVTLDPKKIQSTPSLVCHDPDVLLCPELPKGSTGPVLCA